MTPDKVGADVVLLHDCPQSCMPNPVEGLLEIYENMVEVMLVQKIFFTEDSQVEDLLCDCTICVCEYAYMHVCVCVYDNDGRAYLTCLHSFLINSFLCI